LAKPQSPLTKYAVNAAIHHKIMTEITAPFKNFRMRPSYALEATL